MIGLLDELSGSDYTISLFYLFPPALAAWIMSRRLALFASVINAFVWSWVDLSSGRFTVAVPVYAWNFSSRLISLMIIGMLVFTLRKALDHEKQFSRTDHLTQALNARAFKELLELEMNRSLRYQHPITLAYLDVDNFKEVNDTLGHEEGDHVLSELSASIKKSIRQNDVVGRLGGDEFAILLVETGPMAARKVVAQLQAELNLIIVRHSWPISLSFGVISCSDEYCSAEEMIRMADHAMYSVKKSTKNDAKYITWSEINNRIE